jgi:hypothetical protein
MISYNQFEYEAKERGYFPIRQRDTLYVIRSENGVKVELNTKANSYVAGYNLNTEQRGILIDEIFKPAQDGKPRFLRKKKVESPLAHAEYQGLEHFWIWVGCIEAIEAIRPRSNATKLFSKDVAEQDIFLKIAKTYLFAIRIKHQFLLDTCRRLLAADDIDHLITVGRSTNETSDNYYREHVVPCVMIHNEVLRMFEECGSPDDEIDRVSEMIQANLKIVRITNEEAANLDIQLNLRTKMPNGWKFGGDIFERLKIGGVEIVEYPTPV